MKGRADHLVLLFHSVDDRKLHSFADLGNIHPFLFEKAIGALKKDFEVVGLNEMVDVLSGDLPVKERLLAVTFDDGPKSYAVNALPVMEALGIPSTCFLITDCIGDKAIYWRYFFNYCIHSGFGEALASIASEEFGKTIPEEEILKVTRVEFSKEKSARMMDSVMKELISEKEYREAETGLFLSDADIRELKNNSHVNLGIHTRTHPVMSRLSDSEIMDEMSGSLDYYEQSLGIDEPMFSIPFGRLYKDYDERTVLAAGDLSLKVVLSAYGGDNARGQPLYNIRRIPVREEMIKEGPAEFLRRLEAMGTANDYREAEERLYRKISGRLE
jgi:peptidoglycan/xylan/chitin deacetylase (PgdA/CDA1 family)